MKITFEVNDSDISHLDEFLDFVSGYSRILKNDREAKADISVFGRHESGRMFFLETPIVDGRVILERD